MILSLSGLCLENLPAGMLRRTTLDGARARGLIEEAAAAGRLIGIFEFGATPDSKPRKRFHQLLDALRTVHGIELDPKAFCSEAPADPADDPADGPSYYANPLQLYRADADRPMLVVSYYLTAGQDDFLDMDVSPDSLTFDLVEAIPAADTGLTDQRA
jgi:hypothetical protein